MPPHHHPSSTQVPRCTSTGDAVHRPAGKARFVAGERPNCAARPGFLGWLSTHAGGLPARRVGGRIGRLPLNQVGFAVSYTRRATTHGGARTRKELLDALWLRHRPDFELLLSTSTLLLATVGVGALNSAPGGRGEHMPQT